jgi:membrane fusion protein, multidrug efflux system
MENTLIKREPMPIATGPAANGPAAPQKETDTGTNTAAVPSVRKQEWPWIIGLIAAVAACIASFPWIQETMNTVSTDDAYVNGYVTYVAPRVSGQVTKVFVEDNNIVHKGDLLLELDSEPYQVRVNISEAAVAAAKADLIAAEASARGSAGLVRSLVFGLQHAMDAVKDKVATLKLRVATLDSKRASLARAESDYNRNKPLVASRVVSQQDMDAYTEAYLVARAEVQEALQAVYEIRVSLGLPATPSSGNDLTQAPANLDETFSAVREAQGKLIEAASSLGVRGSFDKLPREMMADFYSRYPRQSIDEIFAHLLKDAPAVKQARTKLLQAEQNLADAKLNLSYCNVYAEIDGAVTGRSVNPGNHVQTGQSLMTVRSLTEIWIDANFKETQLRDLRIGQRVSCELDMYGSHKEFEGRITGFTMGTGQTLSLLPPQNATGNFVKIVQRLPVRIELTDYQPDNDPLFVGLSVEPKVYFKEPPSGPNAGEVLQPHSTISPASIASRR